VGDPRGGPMRIVFSSMLHGEVAQAMKRQPSH